MLFNRLGRKIPSDKCRVFANAERKFYKINEPSVDIEVQHEKAVNLELLDKSFEFDYVKGQHDELYNLIKKNNDYQNLLLGTCIPFAISNQDLNDNVGLQLEEKYLPLIKKNYEQSHQSSWFKATLQGQNTLKDSLRIVQNSAYQNFLTAAANGCVVGCYFPTAFQEYDIASQRNQINLLPKNDVFNICLSGHVEASYSLIMYPDLLFSKKNYSPILCISALEHVDPRMVLMFKSYGPHLEFWLMSQMMTQSQTQVSEQWAGGLTIYKVI